MLERGRSVVNLKKIEVLITGQSDRRSYSSSCDESGLGRTTASVSVPVSTTSEMCDTHSGALMPGALTWLLERLLRTWIKSAKLIKERNHDNRTHTERLVFFFYRWAGSTVCLLVSHASEKPGFVSLSKLCRQDQRALNPTPHNAHTPMPRLLCPASRPE